MKRLEKLPLLAYSLNMSYLLLSIDIGRVLGSSVSKGKAVDGLSWKVRNQGVVVYVKFGVIIFLKKFV